MLITCNQPNDNALTDYKSPWYRCVNSCMHSVYLKSKSTFRWKWPSCVNLETSSCTCQTSPALIGKMLIRNFILLQASMCLYDLCWPLMIADSIFPSLAFFVLFLNLSPVYATNEGWKSFCTLHKPYLWPDRCDLLLDKYSVYVSVLV